MYERSAIVLERYFENLLGYRKEGNIRDNFNNYCDLVEKLEKYQINYEKELAATEEFEESLKKIRLVQASQKKLYEKSVKLEYNRNLLFNNIEAKIDDTRKCIEKIEADVEKNNKEMADSKEKLINALTVYNEKRFELSKCKRYKKMAEKAYTDAYEIAVNNYDSISPETIEFAKEFANFDDAEDIIVELENNGKNEKIPFNEDVIRNATVYGIETAKKEVAGYIILHEKMTKLLADIEEGATKIELHKQYARNEKSKMDFIYAVKDYLTQFLDYERMTVIHGRKSHNRLMSEACENFEADIIQINNLFELLVKEITNKSTKKAYKELYNKKYLLDIQEKDEKFKREKNRVNLNTATLINSNYWRIEGIREIFTIFYKTVSEVLGRNVDEFDVLKTESDEFQENTAIETDKDSYVEEPQEVEKIPFEIDDSKKRKAKSITIEEDDDDDDLKPYVYSDNDEEDEDDEEYSASQYLEKDSFNKFEKNNLNELDDEIEDDDYNTADDMIDDLVQNFQNETSDEDFDIFGEKYKEIDSSEKIKEKTKKVSKDTNSKKKNEEILETSKYDFEDDEETLFADIKTVKKRGKAKNEIQEMKVEESKPKTIIKKVRKIAKTKKKTAESDIW
ncbi:MAG: hypothetical protein IKL55_01245 [Clostridia bacterium]|nr:hypothetical protein [Clostridia bacterium]